MNGSEETGRLVYGNDAEADPPRARQRTLGTQAPSAAPPRSVLRAAGPDLRAGLRKAAAGEWNGEAGQVMREDLRSRAQAVSPLYRQTMGRVSDDLRRDALRAGLGDLFRRAWGTTPE